MLFCNVFMKQNADYHIIMFLFIAISTCLVDILTSLFCTVYFSPLFTYTPQIIFYGVVDIVPLNFLHETGDIFHCIIKTSNIC